MQMLIFFLFVDLFLKLCHNIELLIEICHPGLFIPRVLREISSSNLKFSTKFSFHVSVLSTPFVQIFPFFQTTLYLTSTHQQKTIFFLAVFFSHIVIPELIKISQTLHIDLRLFWMQIK